MSPKPQTRVLGEYTALVLLTAVAGVLRFYKLGDWSYFIDELRTWDDTLRTISNPIPLATWLRLDNRTGFWLLTHLSFEIFGVSAFSMRLFPCIFGTLTVPFLYFPLKVLFDKRLAFLAVSIFAISPWHIYMSQMARWYTVLMLAMFFALFSFYFYIERGDLKYLLLYALFFILAISNHLTAGFVPVIAATYVLALMLLPSFRSQNLAARRLSYILAGHAALSLALVPKFLRFMAEWRTQAEFSGSWGSDVLLKLVYHATPTIIVIALIGLALALRREDRRGLFLAIYCLLPVLAAGVMAMLDVNVSVRYPFCILPAMFTAASYCLMEFKDQLRKSGHLLTAGLILVAVLPSLQSDYLYFTSEYGYRDRTREALKFIDREALDDEQVFCAPTLFTPEDTEFYCKAMAQVENLSFIARRLSSPMPPDGFEGTKRIWLVTFGRLPGHPDKLWEWISANTRLRAEFPAHRGNQDMTTKVLLYPAAGTVSEFQASSAHDDYARVAGRNLSEKELD